MYDAELRVYVPDIYQESIYTIDYETLKKNGILLLSFDIDDTLNDSIDNKVRHFIRLDPTMLEEVKDQFGKLKKMGLTVTLLSNKKEEIVKSACEQLDAYFYVSEAKKPKTQGFERMLEEYKIDKSQMVHIGNSIRDDIAGGNRAGVITCLIRRNGFWMKVPIAMKPWLLTRCGNAVHSAIPV